MLNNETTVSGHRNQLDLESYWMPFTPNRQFKSQPRLFVGAKGMHYTCEDGRQIIDGFAGLWCCNAGHGNPEIAEAVRHQLIELDFAPSFNLGHPKVFEFAERLKRISPAGLDHVFFTNSGSESVDTALKIALAYHQANGEGARTRFIGRERAYHGVGFGGISVSGMVNNRRQFGAMLPGVDHLISTYSPENSRFSRGQPAWGAHLADDLERLVALHGAETIAAVIVEPVSGATGVLPPPVGYLERLREITRKYGILLIFDEVITAFGRLGAPFAANRFGITPDLICTAKAITNGVVPMGAVFAHDDVYNGLMSGPESEVELFHGYTYSGHPVACAAGLATLDIYMRDNLLTRADDLAEYWEDALHELRAEPFVTDVRNIGLMGAVELQSRDGSPGQRAFEVQNICWANGALVRPVGDSIALSPPLIISPEQIDELVAIIRSALREVA
ncbi:aspartate aminotransferase family protein [Aquicoccus sp. G2-2]|uniref:aspartate aminotransferase family protein n=1 Tax=Aquicoccus sp. G2-2 TaxID=3092120 RepID=UPI002AE01EFC|nr:aspartate aminotransferase family protein [Aquicoccus sp. G2-2]MEA1115264.1 aspartate aminotransferase family protein [Aquicoccus sp. G2-2]